ncbi:aspartate kinase [Paenisporosarcina cavernae]|uniref:Aspartokinase n=1 Tax=Paenisporosarcina cavernae TaxID=2320858 RepID=A0A385YTE8_9BACL|nr:aspartate kinase [Paenisporosarcina cavernae]AYC29791.1 aspartate kinase [Paenisporosarcina cavernae]
MSKKIVMKFGGTSVATPERIQHVAKRIMSQKLSGYEVIVVVSAMGKTTDQLVHLAQSITSTPSKREMDMLLATGEQVTIALLTMALHELEVEAKSFTGSQAGIITESVHRNARIEEMNVCKILQTIENGTIAIVAGFQGVDIDGEITTLGRGGSDTTAVALAAAIHAERCDIYTDVDGVYSCDPRYVTSARKLEEISYDEMLELANLGAGVLHPRSVEFAKNYQLPLRVRSSMASDEGTLVLEETEMEKNQVVRGVAFEKEIVRMTISYVKPFNGSLAKIFTTLAKHHVNVDIIVQSIQEGIAPSVSFSIKNEDFADAMAVLQQEKDALGYTSLDFEAGLSKVSIVGSGMVSNPGVAAQMFDRLRVEGIPIKMVSTSEIKVSVVVPQEQMVQAAEVLHEEFHLHEVLENVN